MRMEGELTEFDVKSHKTSSNRLFSVLKKLVILIFPAGQDYLELKNETNGEAHKRRNRQELISGVFHDLPEEHVEIAEIPDGVDAD